MVQFLFVLLAFACFCCAQVPTHIFSDTISSDFVFSAPGEIVRFDTYRALCGDTSIYWRTANRTASKLSLSCKNGNCFNLNSTTNLDFYIWASANFAFYNIYVNGKTQASTFDPPLVVGGSWFHYELPLSHWYESYGMTEASNITFEYYLWNWQNKMVNQIYIDSMYLVHNNATTNPCPANSTGVNKPQPIYVDAMDPLFPGLKAIEPVVVKSTLRKKCGAYSLNWKKTAPDSGVDNLAMYSTYASIDTQTYAKVTFWLFSTVANPDLSLGLYAGPGDAPGPSGTCYQAGGGILRHVPGGVLPALTWTFVSIPLSNWNIVSASRASAWRGLCFSETKNANLYFDSIYLLPNFTTNPCV